MTETLPMSEPTVHTFFSVGEVSVVFCLCDCVGFHITAIASQEFTGKEK